MAEKRNIFLVGPMGAGKSTSLDLRRDVVINL